MGEIGAPSALPTLASALDDSSPEVRRIAIESLVRFGDEAWPAIRSRIAGGGPLSREIAVAILRKQSDPWLVTQDNGKPNVTALLLLITTSETEELTEYLNRAEIPRLKTETIISLKEAWDIAEEFAELENLIAGGNDPYLYAWRQGEIYSVAARETLQRSFNELHEYFETRDPAALETAGKIRAESRRLEDEARKQKEKIENMSENVKIVGEVRLNRYRGMRELLVRTWEYAIPELRPLAEAVYADRGVDPEFLARESALLD